jgi:predicted Fe-Mo cluster-binding NifX family protein
MKVAITISGNSLQSAFDARFGRAPSFCVVNIETGEWTTHDNPALSASGGAGIQAAEFIAGQGAQAVISGAYGPNAFDTLAAGGVAMYLAPTGETMTASEVLDLFRAGKLTQVKAATHEGHHGGQH